MRDRTIYFSLLLFMLLMLTPVISYAQNSLSGLHGDQAYSYSGLHSGNQIRTSFYNDGNIGPHLYDTPDDVGGEWPINSGHEYMVTCHQIIGSEVKDTDGQIIPIFSEGMGPSVKYAERSSGGDWWCFSPLAGFANDERQRIAMSHWDWSWPAIWPDKMGDQADAGWSGSWNGYFGKNIKNADQESYFVADDYNNREWSFYPDSTDLNRRGLGVRGTFRGFQWSNALVEDLLVVLWDIKNIGTYQHDKMNFGIMSGPNMGRSLQGEDRDDDGGAYSLEEELGWHFDRDNIGAGGWTPVGFHGLAFFESPGNPYDGIDNDGDGINGSGAIISEEMFAPRLINEGDSIVLVNYTSFERTVTTMPAEGITIIYNQNPYHFPANVEHQEIANNLIDDNLNGIIDENNSSVFGEGAHEIRTYLFTGAKYVDYLSGDGLDNILIDEKRDDGIDNDSDWDIVTDDVGLDGVPRTGDIGEGDGIPSSGRGTDLPGEPHIDKTDVDESDMIGLTAFKLYTHSNPDYQRTNDEGLWEGLEPGFFSAYHIGRTNALLGSGYFPFIPEQTERFSLGIMFGENFDDLLANSDYAQKTYEKNYHFAKAPLIPTLNAVPGDNKVTLYWDDVAEESNDPITGKDFEGYRIYRSTDPGWNDMTSITDGKASITYRKPLVQFDLDNEYSGFSAVAVRGVEFFLGENTGIVHIWVDSTVRNGQTYYYAITSYDHGDPALGFAPSECPKYIAISREGKVDKGRNVAIAKPEAPSAGFIDADLSDIELIEGGASGKVGYEIIDPTLIKDNHSYQIVFQDTIIENESSRLVPATKNFSLIDFTNTIDTLINKSTDLDKNAELPLVDGFQIKLFNVEELIIDTDSTFWSNDSIYGYVIEPFKYQGIAMAHDYRIDFGELGIDTSMYAQISRTIKLDPIPVNFKITNLNTNEPVDFAFRGIDERKGESGYFTGFSVRRISDQIIFMEPDKNDSLIFSWSVEFDGTTNDNSHRNPREGDYLIIRTLKPFLSHDVYTFTTMAQSIDDQLARQELDQIRVVPNPYVVANSWEPLNPYTRGRGPRELHFIHLPAKCTIKIFNIRGQLVKEIEHHTPNIDDGTEVWDMLNKDSLEISYGVYIYHIDAKTLGEKTGKFAVIK